MELKAREGCPEDFDGLLRLAYGSRWSDPAIARDVRTEWDWLWKSGRFMASAVMDTESQRLVAFMGAVLITEDFYQALASDPHPYCNRRIGREPHPGDRPLPAREDLLDGTATLLIDYFAWDSKGTEEQAAILRGYAANAFLDFHGGYPMRRLALEVCGVAMLDLAVKSGPVVVNDHQEWVTAQGVTSADHPFLLAIDREAALRTENHWYTRIFRYQPPRMGFSDGQREMLRLACLGQNDRQIADRLCLSPHAIKKRWEAVYERFYERLPGTLERANEGKRGAEKRRIVVATLQERMEELRP